VLSQHAGTIADGGQIELRVDPLELVDERQQRFGADRV
jgi:hypothetical protein